MRTLPGIASNAPANSAEIRLFQAGRYVDIVGVTDSNSVAPTILFKELRRILGFRLCHIHARQVGSTNIGQLQHSTPAYFN